MLGNDLQGSIQLHDKNTLRGLKQRRGTKRRKRPTTTFKFEWELIMKLNKNQLKAIYWVGDLRLQLSTITKSFADAPTAACTLCGSLDCSQISAKLYRASAGLTAWPQHVISTCCSMSNELSLLQEGKITELHEINQYPSH